jgi:hypothetical protein
LRVEGEIQREMTILVFILLHIVTVSSRQINSRDSWLLNLSHGNVLPNTEWTALNQTEQAIFNMKADDWFRHAMRQGDAGHLQFGQIMPQVLFSNPNMTVPAMYDDVGDAAAWTGHFLAALVHKYAVDEDPIVLPTILSILKAWDFHTHNCTGMHGFIPRAWATPSPTSTPWLAFRSYYTSSPPYINGDGSHGIYNCSAVGNTHLLWQGGSSRDTYIGVMFGLGSTLMTLKNKSNASEHYLLAQTVFERIFDKLSSDLYFIVYPPTCTKANWKECVPVNPTPTFIAAFERVALFVNPVKYASVQNHYDKFLTLAISTEYITPMGHSAYYGNNLLSACWYLLLRMEKLTMGKHFQKMQSKLTQLLVDYRPHLQANLNAYWVAACNDTAPDAGPWNTLAQALLWDFPNPPDPEAYVNQSKNTLYGNKTNCSESCGCSTWSMLVRDRPPNEFVWQITPNKLESGAGSKPTVTPKTEFGGAFLVPYWIWRTAGIL